MDAPENELILSDVSMLEIVMKHSAGKLPLPDLPRKWLPAKLDFHQLVSLPLSVAVMFRSGELPRVHSDPFDRLLASQAIEEGLCIVSPDTLLSDLGASRVW